MIDLVTRASEGDHLAFEQLATVITGRFDGIARLILHDRDQAADAVQEALVHMWRQLPKLRDPARFDAWSRRLVVNACIDEIRRNPRHSVVDLSSHASIVPDAYGHLGDRDELAAGLRQLKVEQRVVLVLRYYVGLEPAEIAETLKIPQGTARSRIHNALQALRAVVEADARGQGAARL